MSRRREADIIVALGGDGFMLQTMHRFMEKRTPIFGMNRGSVGFLMNSYEDDGLIERLRRAESIDLRPLRMTVEDIHGERHEVLAINEDALLRDTRFAAKIRIFVDGIMRMEEMICDGVLVSTPAGSTAYNNAVHGPHPAAGRRASGDVADQRLPAAALARCPSAAARGGHLRGDRPRTTPRPGRGRLYRSPRCHPSQRRRQRHGGADHSFRPRTQSRGTHHQGTICAVSDDADSTSPQPRNARLRNILAFLFTIALGTIGGYLFLLATMPLPWMMGAMLVTTAAALLGVPLRSPGKFRGYMIAIIGLMVGSAFTPDILKQATHWIFS